MQSFDSETSFFYLKMNCVNLCGAAMPRELKESECMSEVSNCAEFLRFGTFELRNRVLHHLTITSYFLFIWWNLTGLIHHMLIISISIRSENQSTKFHIMHYLG